jgi:transcriptional regulator with XRE-family HTH domain
MGALTRYAADQLSFGGLLRRLRAEADLTQGELAEAAQLSPRSVSDLERGINRTARKDTAELVAGAVGLDGPVRESFVAAARGCRPAEDVLAAREGRTPGLGRLGVRGMPVCPYWDPLTELATHLAAVGGPDVLAVRDGLARHPDQAHLAIRSAVLAAAARRDEEAAGSGEGAAQLVLIVDQFEQVFTLNPDLSGEAAGQAFITALCAAAANPAGSRQEPAALVVVAVRGDFSDRCAAVPELVGALQDGHFVVGPMTESELRVAITGPTASTGLQIDPALTDTILGDLRVAGADRSAGVLPLLSQAMALTWEQREGDRLTSRGHAQAGGVSHAVQTGADRVYGALPAGQQALAQGVLRSMTVASRDGGYARRPVTRDDLYAGLPRAARADIDAVLDAWRICTDDLC